jgi:predicted cupin superfamily sugar epimerase
MKPSAAYWIKKLQLTPHVEGGAFREVYKSDLVFPQTVLPPAFGGGRHACTSIYFLLEQGDFSSLHRIASDEIWHFYAGDSLLIYEIDITGLLLVHHLGCSMDNGEQFQCVIKAGSWFGAKLYQSGEYALTGCTVAPGFDYKEFELGTREKLLKQFPQHKLIIEEMTR